LEEQERGGMRDERGGKMERRERAEDRGKRRGEEKVPTQNRRNMISLKE
jgi:hypothetical protein